MKYAVNYWSGFAAATAMVATLMTVAAPPLAYADDNAAVKRIEQKNREAMENYDLLDYEGAKKGLNEALAIAKRSRLERHPAKALTHLYLGILEYSGFGDEDSAILQFMEAVDIDPSVKVPAAYRTRELAALLERAREEVGAAAAASRAAPPAVGDDPSSPGAGASSLNCRDVIGMQHKLVDAVTAGADRAVEVALAADVGAAKVSLYYRPPGDTAFTEVPMARRGDCEYAALIPGTAIRGEFLHYYVAALSGGGKVLAAKGSAGSPNIIEVQGGAGPSRAGGGDDENPLGVRGGRSIGTSIGTGAEHDFFLAFTIGGGGGYVTGNTESTGDEVGCCFAPALFHVFPELGFYLSPRTALSAAVRLGFPIGANIDQHSPGAPSGMARVRHTLGADGTGIMLSGSLGGGVMRNTVKLKEPADPEMDVDTVALGPLIAGVGAGYVSALGGPMLFNVELNALAGIPIISELAGAQTEFGVQFDVNLGLLFAF
jgi:hypothetical protein